MKSRRSITMLCMRWSLEEVVPAMAMLPGVSPLKAKVMKLIWCMASVSAPTTLREGTVKDVNHFTMTYPGDQHTAGRPEPVRNVNVTTTPIGVTLTLQSMS
jgi:hypothetical protein